MSDHPQRSVSTRWRKLYNASSADRGEFVEVLDRGVEVKAELAQLSGACFDGRLHSSMFARARPRAQRHNFRVPGCAARAVRLRS
jgi:hypothetical protein